MAHRLFYGSPLIKKLIVAQEPALIMVTSSMARTAMERIRTMIANGISPDSSYSSTHSSSTSSAVDWMFDCFGIVFVGVPVDPICWVEPIFTVACGSALAPPGCSGVVARPTGPGPPLPGAFARGMVLAPTGDGGAAIGAETDAIGTGRVGPRGSGAPGPVATGFVGPIGSGAFDSGIVFAPVGVDAEGARGGAGAEGGGGTGAPEGAGGLGGAALGEVGGARLPMGAVVGPPVGSGAVASIGSVAADRTGLVAGIPAIEAVEGPPEGIGAVEPFGATGPDSSDGARKLILTVSFFNGTVEVLADGFSGS